MAATPPPRAADDAYALFLRARSAVSAARYPSRLDYTIDVSGLDGETPKANHYRASASTIDGSIALAPISNEEMASPPPVPRGMNWSLSGKVYEGRGETGAWIYTVPVGHPALPPDLLGVPLIAPTYMFGLNYAAPQHVASPADDPATLPTIAIVATNRRDYAVTLVDEPQLGGIPTYHLKLTPLRKPHDHRLRELWIGETDYLPRRAIVAGNFTIAPLVDVPWTIDFNVAGSVPFVAREAAAQTLYLAHRRVVRNAAIAFENVREASGGFLDRPIVTPAADDSALVEP